MTSFRRDIEGLRGLAVGAVVLFHYFPGVVPGGFAGVDLFFVVSGFLITGLIKARASEGSFSFAEFYARRTKRILPAALLTFSAVLACSTVVLTPGEFKAVAQQAIAAVASVSNVLFWRQLGYFTNAAEHTPLLNTWSLGVEEQFYLLEPLALVLLYRSRLRARVGPVFGAFVGLAWALAVAMTFWKPGVAFFLLPTRLWELGIGGLLHWLNVARLRRSTLAAGAGLLGVLGSLFFLDGKTPFPGLAATPICVGTALLLVTDESAVNRVALSFAPLRFLGKISYSLYLIHWPLLSLSVLATNGELTALHRAALTVASLGLAMASEHWVERPLRAEPLSHRATAVRYGLLAAGTMLLGGVVWFAEGFPGRSATSTARLEELSALDGMGTRERHEHATSFGQVPLVRRCHQAPWDAVAALSSECIDGAGPETAVVWGDSHAAHYHPAVRAAEPGALFHASRSACPPAPPDAAFSEVPPPWRADCAAFNGFVLERIERTPTIKRVYLGAVWSTWMNDAYRASLNTLRERLEAGGREVFILGEVPTQTSVAANCRLRQGLFTARFFDFPRCEAARDANPRRVEAARALRASSPRYFDPDPTYCEPATGRCRAVEGDAVLYLDLNHLLIEGAERLGPPLREFVAAHP